MTPSSQIQKILRQPNAQQQFELLRSALLEESKRRRVFYEWVDETMKAEFINGEIVIHSPVRIEHWQASEMLVSMLSLFTKIKKSGKVGFEKVMISLTRNDYEPDIVFFKKEKADTFIAGQVLFPAPDFVVEILSKKTAVTDRTTKKEDYAAHGIGEYWIIDAQKQTIEQYLLLSETDTSYFQPYIFRIGDDISSRVIEGFTIPVQAVFDEAVNLKTLTQFI